MKKEGCLFETMEAEREWHKMSLEYIAEVLDVLVPTYEGWLKGETEMPGSAIALGHIVGLSARAEFQIGAEINH